jgi:hypothetical protein
MPDEDFPLADYFLFGTGPDSQILLEIVLPYLRAHGVTTGFRLEEARFATSVTIVGGEEVASPSDEQALRDAGCQVRRLPNDPLALAEDLNL